MASAEEADLVTQFEKFCVLKNSNKNKTQFSSKACEKLVKDCFEDQYKFKGLLLTNIVDSSVFSQCKQKGTQYMPVNNDNCEHFLKKAAHEFAKLKTKNRTLPDKAPEVEEIYTDLRTRVLSTDPKVQQIKASKTGNVDRLTDSSKFTGSHKERFDETGKGRGKAGRMDEVKNSGYVGNYKGEGTFDKKGS